MSRRAAGLRPRISAEGEIGPVGACQGHRRQTTIHTYNEQWENWSINAVADL